MLSIAKKGVATVYNLLSPSKTKSVTALADMDKNAARLASFKASKSSGKKRTSTLKGKQAGKWPHQTPTPEQVRKTLQHYSEVLTSIACARRLLLRTDGICA